MSAVVTQTGIRHYEVRIERIGLVGHIYDFLSGPFKFKYAGDKWMEMTYEENALMLDVVEPKLTLLNITKRLTG